jgi:hypothetical protein
MENRGNGMLATMPSARVIAGLVLKPMALSNHRARFIQTAPVNRADNITAIYTGQIERCKEVKHTIAYINTDKKEMPRNTTLILVDVNVRMRAKIVHRNQTLSLIKGILEVEIIKTNRY